MPSIWLLYSLSIILSIFFVRTSVSITVNCSSTRASCIYCLDSDLPSTWYNNNSVIMDGWQMRVFLVQRNQNAAAFYCGFYCSGACNSYVFSVVSVGGGDHSVVWSANKDSPVKGNAMIQLTRQELVLRDSDGTQVWSSNTSGSIVGMNLNQAGNLALFSDENATIWQSPVNKSAIIVPRPSAAPRPPPPREILPNSQPKLAPSPLPENEPKPPPAPNKKDGTKLVAIIAGSGAAGFICFIIVLVFVKLWRTKVEEDVEDYIKQVPGMPVSFSYEDLRLATENFKEKLGGGGFGSVFSGVLADGTRIAVKRLDKLGQGMREFLAEVETIGSLHHFNLVRLIGFCAEKSFRLLVYEYMSNGSLDKWIFYKDQRPCLDWQTRKKIILDIAKGLAYLHEDCRHKIIHLDIKPQNILLDENFNAKVSDFGLSALIDREESQVLTTMRGTPGYLAPEWRQLRITVKVDIYSFGIVLLEVVSTRRNVDRSRSESSFHLLKVLQRKAEEEKLIDVVEDLDEDMQNHREEVERMIRIGAWCLQNDPTKRPLMSTVVKVLEGVMEVDPNINYNFSYSTPSPAVFNDHVSSAAPPASVLSNPR